MPDDFLQIRDRPVLISGLANKKSVAWAVGEVLREAGARVMFSVRTSERADSVRRFVGDAPVFVCDVQDSSQIEALRDAVVAESGGLFSLVHSVAFADYRKAGDGFHETPRDAFLEAVDISCYSLIAMANAFRDHIDPQGSVVTISISSTTTAAENYGFMAPAKAALNSSVVFLAKSFSRFSEIRFNAVCAGPLKTASSAGIPGYADSYLHAEKMTLRHRGVATAEVANLAAFLISPRSAGINAQGIVIDAGLGTNAFDAKLME